MIEYRVTKFDPALRDARGAYTADDRVLFKQIGGSFGGKVLTEGEYVRVEQAYIDSATAFLREGGIDSLTVEGIENHKGLTLEIGEGSTLSLASLAVALRLNISPKKWVCTQNCFPLLTKSALRTSTIFPDGSLRERSSDVRASGLLPTRTAELPPVRISFHDTKFRRSGGAVCPDE
jgi:hypothetical protein